ncbi:hypothetical protein LOD99_5638 [Oopsacas minuta]|uniref:Uncharacterized protein n=1 Tax=Oopsacas minuta TaxID=111878 RepID=A0AAV7JQR4_9METZ|nr:hypothetical protein LOD99_5638 [Oopsacas minuta]
MNTSKQNQNIRKNTSLLTFFKSKQPSATEDLVVSNEVASDYAVRKQKYSLYSLVWGRSEFGWCPAIIEKDSNTALYYREGSNSIEEWHLRFLTEPASRSWRYEEDIQLFQLDKFPHLLETDKFRGSTKSALNKAEELFHLPPDERADSLTDDACINLSQSESEDEVIKTVRKDVSNYIQNRPSKRKSKLSFQSKQKE